MHGETQALVVALEGKGIYFSLILAVWKKSSQPLVIVALLSTPFIRRDLMQVFASRDFIGQS